MNRLSPTKRAEPSDLLCSQFDMAGGSVPGRRHIGCGNLLAGKNNQDAIGFYACDDMLVITVHDGCGSTPYSEFGARLAANIIPAAIREAAGKDRHEQIDKQAFWQQVQQIALSRFAAIASLCCSNQMSLNSESNFARQHLLFTILGALITKDLTVVFGMGDGVFAINGKATTIGPFPDNAPDYLCKPLISTADAPDFVLHARIRTEKLESLILGTDGVQDLISSASKRIPGKSRSVGTITDLLKQDFLFSNFSEDGIESAPLDSLTGWLRQINSEVTKQCLDEEGSPIIKREEGLLPDDTTIVALRRQIRSSSALQSTSTALKNTETTVHPTENTSRPKIF